jgi:ubiquinone biosynthesis protein
MVGDQIAHYAPKVYRNYSGLRVLTLEHIFGVTVRDIISAINKGDTETLANWGKVGITPERTATILLRSVLEQTVRFRTFNADPHPSNLIVMEGGTLTWVDFGAVGWIDERQRTLQFELREAFAQGHEHGAYLALLKTMEPLPERRDLRGFERDIKQNIRDYLLAAEDSEAPLAEKSAGMFFLRTLRTLRQSRLPMSVATMALYRTILIADMVVLRLYPTVNWVAHLRRFLQDMSPDLARQSLEQALSAASAVQFAQAPLALQETVEWVAGRLPQVGRATIYTLSMAERLVLALMRLFRAGTLIVGLISVLLILNPDARDYAERWNLQLLTPDAWPVIVACGIVFLTLNSLIRRAESA